MPREPNRLISLLLGIAGGVATWLAFPGAGWWPLAYEGTALLFLALRRDRAWWNALVGLCWGAAFFLPLIWWADEATGIVPWLALSIVEAGFVDVLFGGNAIATHDIESALYGTSLGVDLSKGRGVEHGHEHHIRAINRIRAAGSISAAVEDGLLTSGVMHALVTAGKEFVLVGSVRDDGPLPDVVTDVIDGQRRMREALGGVGFAIMVATMLHSVATGNLLPASVPLVCVDINPATVTKLADRGSSQARGVVTDIGLFLEQLANELNPGWRERLTT